jgi:hypothetical protein
MTQKPSKNNEDLSRGSEAEKKFCFSKINETTQELKRMMQWCGWGISQNDAQILVQVDNDATL